MLTTSTRFRISFSDSFPLPFTFKRCDAIDALINSTHLAFGDTSPGQIAALADAVAKDDQDFPGYCCQDTAEKSGIWGEPVSAVRADLVSYGEISYNLVGFDRVMPVQL